MRYFDLAIILLYLVAITIFGARFRTGQKTLKDYFLGGRTAPWWAISLSIVSAETSTLTIVGTPSLAFGGNLGFLQIVLGYLLARIVISVVFLPQYFRGEMFTAYELMRRRFGENVRKLTASIFLVTRALAEGVRVFAISLVISIVLGTGEIASIVLIVLLTLFYTFEGGMTAVIWTDVVQMTLYVAGAIASFVIILHQIPGGWEHVAQVAGAAHKFTIFDFRFAPNMEFFSRTYSFWAGIAGGCFLTTATHGTDQLMVQRLLSARDERQSRTALLASWGVILMQFVLFLLIGVLLYVHYSDLHLTAPAQRDRLYPEFVWNNLPVGLAGLIIAAILAAAMANLSAALNSLASTTVVDFYRARSKSLSDAAALRMARLATIAWGGVLLAIAIAARHSKSVLEAGLTIGSIPMGALLGVFLLGVLTRKPREGAAIAGVVCGLVTVIGIHFYTPIAWTWYVLIGTVTTFGVGILASLFQGPAAIPLETIGVREPSGHLPYRPPEKANPED
ncbi:MAG: sodium:solute symporter [Candidatus Solibacter sp.]